MDRQSLSLCSMHSSGRRQSRDKPSTWKVGLGARSVGVGVIGIAFYGGCLGKIFLIRCDYRCDVSQVDLRKVPETDSQCKGLKMGMCSRCSRQSTGATLLEYKGSGESTVSATQVALPGARHCPTLFPEYICSPDNYRREGLLLALIL